MIDQPLAGERVLPLIPLHFGLSALRREFETKIFISPSAAAFSLTKVKRSSSETFGNVMMKGRFPFAKGIVESVVIHV